MKFNKKYDAFSDKNKGLHEVYPELSFIIREIYLGDAPKVSLDTVFRFVVYFYDRDCVELQLHTDIMKARDSALKKFGITGSTADAEYFQNAENEMALRYMLYGCDNRFNVFISLSIQLANMLGKVRERDKGSSWNDNLQSLKSSNEIMEISENLDTMRRDLFGDMKHIEQYSMQKELDSMFKAETAMI